MKKEEEIKSLDNQQKAKTPLVTTKAQLIMSTAEVDNNNQNDLSCSLIGDETKNDEFICIKEALKLLNVSEDTFRKKYLQKLKESNIKKTTANTGGKKFFYKKSTILRLKEEEENQRVVKIQSKATKLAEKNDELTVAEAFKQKIQGAGADTIFQSAMALMEVALNELRKENNTLKIQLDQTNEYYTMKRVLIINEKEEKWKDEKGKKHFTYNPFLLAKTSRKMNKDIKLCPDVNFDTINSYHIDVWKECYPNEKY